MTYLDDMLAAYRLLSEFLRDSKLSPMTPDEFVELGFKKDAYGRVVGELKEKPMTINTLDRSVYWGGMMMKYYTMRWTEESEK